MPYKPGAIRLPPGGVPGITAAVALPAPGSGGSGDRPGTAASATMPPAASLAAWTDPSRPPTSAAGPRPVTASPLTHSLSADPSGPVLLRVPQRPETGAAGGGRAGLPPRSANPRLPPVPGTAASAPGGPVRRFSDVGLSSQLSAEELKQVMAVLAVVRPQTAAALLQRPTTAGGPAGPGGACVGAGASAVGLLRPATAGPAGRRPGSARAPPAARSTGTAARLGGGVGSLVPPGTAGPAPGGEEGGDTGKEGEGGVVPRPPASGRPPASRPLTRTRSAPASAPLGAPPSRAGSSGGRRLPSAGAAAEAATAAAVAATAEAAAAGVGIGALGARPGTAAPGGGNPLLSSLLPIPEDAELPGGGGLPTAGAVSGWGLPPLEPLDPDPQLDKAWAAIVAANQRPDTGALVGGLDVFSRPPTGAFRLVRQAAPMVLVLDDLAQSTPEVVERELEHMSLDELQALRSQLGMG
ncbi:hypothetical protein HYH03_007439 [Edaphochlamys debaryana]|uniref:Uncharacterized protein n=1 Tax=Edaphochlamys debaryana TaxID=47281 RepID=A0A835Y1X5_9CHLO|nr:hypothetical protein HYH03_007439 [Edaphochlamys debaryana]|eukprot:KAG2494385.1 hypothetical protein HYH03_007439 [Edaphochlamys debaryana]